MDDFKDKQIWEKDGRIDNKKKGIKGKHLITL